MAAIDIKVWKMKLTIKPVPKKDLERFHELRKEYGSGYETWEDTIERYEKWPNLLVGLYLNGELIGGAVGKSWHHFPSDSVILNNIAIEFKHWRKGFGSKLLRYLEKQVNKMGKKTVTVGAAENVDGFYLANGYKPVSYCVNVDPTKLPDNYKDLGYEIRKEREEGREKVFNIPTKKYKPEEREKIRKTFNARQVIYIYEKAV